MPGSAITTRAWFILDDLDDEDKLTPRDVGVTPVQVWTSDAGPQQAEQPKGGNLAPSPSGDWREFVSAPERKEKSAGCTIQ